MRTERSLILLNGGEHVGLSSLQMHTHCLGKTQKAPFQLFLDMKVQALLSLLVKALRQLRLVITLWLSSKLGLKVLSLL